MTSAQQFIKWARLYIFVISSFQLLISISFLIFDEGDGEFKLPDWLMFTNLIVSVGGLLALRRRKITYYVTILSLRLALDILILFYVIGFAESVIDLISSVLFFSIFLLGPELVILKIFQNPSKFNDE